MAVVCQHLAVLGGLFTFFGGVKRAEVLADMWTRFGVPGRSENLREPLPRAAAAATLLDRADERARRPREAKLAADPELAGMVSERLAMRWSPHAICTDLCAEGRRITAEAIYSACYDHTGSRGLRERSWRLLPRRCRRREPRSRGARKPTPLGAFKPIAARPAAVEDRREPGNWEGASRSPRR